MNTKQKKKGKKKLVIWSIVGLLAATIMSAVLFTPKGSGNVEEEKAQTADITTYYTFSGTVEAKNKKTIMSGEAMQIKEIKVKAGDQVKNGDVLLVTKQDKKIKAALNGEISKIYVEKNAQLMAGAQLIDIVDYSVLQTNVKVDEYDLKYLKTGQEVNVTINALEKEIKGTVAAVSKEATNENGVSYFTATIDLSKDEAVKVGMSTEAKILKQNVKGVTTLSMKAINFDSKNKPYVLIPAEKGMTSKKYIQTGINDGTTIEVKSGINPGERVIISNKDNAAPAMMHGGNQ
ncbi:efflux RND transporter periplasmic adaptor subunit [Neobacillus sp. NRS-1170]|uniref:efflux RND transporter periplasmic adaptor subunit n=1 Tax=Neobacillus sp. NRS-1170 TaxID=3233898 RepID=UPI003D290337